MRPRIKICGLTRPEDARMARELGTDYFGVVLYPASPRHVPARSLTGLVAAIPSGQRVAVHVTPEPAELQELRTLGFDFFQVHYDPVEVADAVLTAWKDAVGADRLWLAPRLPPRQEFPPAALKAAHTLLLDTYQQGTFGGSGRTGDWSHFRALAERHTRHRWILSGGLNPENVRAALRATGATIIDVNSGVESAPGIKDAVLLDLLFANLADD
jgi:phosphoribosylanthranilate isomerase